MSWQTACHKCGRRIRETMTPICDECAAAEGGLLDAKLAPTSAPAKPAWSLPECRERNAFSMENDRDVACTGCPFDDAPHAIRQHISEDEWDVHNLLALVDEQAKLIERMRPFLRHGFDCVYERDRRDITCPELRACDCGLAEFGREIADGGR